MELGNQEFDNALRQIVDSAARYRLAVLRYTDSVYDDTVLNVGMELAESIEKMEMKYGQNPTRFQFEVSDALEKIIYAHIATYKDLGPAVFLGNLGILFEKDLHIDVVGLLRRISRTTLTVLLWPGEVDEQRIYFLHKGSKITINQSDINFNII